MKSYMPRTGDLEITDVREMGWCIRPQLDKGNFNTKFSDGSSSSIGRA